MDKLQDFLRTLNNSAFRYSAAIDEYKKGENLLYTDEQGTEVPVYFTKYTLSNDILKYVVVDKSGTDISTYKQHLKRPEELDISTILIKSADYEKSLPNLNEEELQAISHPKPLNPMAQLWLSYYSGIMKHCPKHVMIKLAEMGVLPKNFCFIKIKELQYV